MRKICCSSQRLEQSNLGELRCLTNAILGALRCVDKADVEQPLFYVAFSTRAT
jgi:hypothetical protein